MCGLAGGMLARAESSGKTRLDQAVRKMCDRMQTRGPDAEGYWSDPNVPVSLGHRRLSILDLDARATQPMHSADRRYVIVFNGEIYNFRELRAQLEAGGEPFVTQSDTEVLLALFARHGESMLGLLRGMFALAIWDTQRRRWFLARDPYGIKPLYLARCAGGWLFASQVKALLASGLVSAEPDPVGQAGFWLLGSVPEPHTWFRDISMLPAGHYLWIDEDLSGEPVCYADIGAAWRNAPGAQVDDRQALEQSRDALLDSVRAHLVSDVPVGVFLSGGIDSGTLAALMRDAGARDIQGVTIAFGEFSGGEDDEAPIATRVAAQYGIKHSIRQVGHDEFETDLPRIMQAMDQPSVDGFNTWYASKAVAELGLKVVVSGVGGDELFQGYSSFRDLPRLVSRWQTASRIPGIAPIARVAMALQSLRSGNPRWRLLPDLAHSVGGAWFLRRGVFSPMELPQLMGAELAREAVDAVHPEALVERMSGPVAGNARLALGQIESMSYLRNQLLRDSDWASMAHSVELRTPLVDAWLLRDLTPLLASFERFPGKGLLAQAPGTPLAADIRLRSKTGFGTPVASWLRQQRQPGPPHANPRIAASLAWRVARECYGA